MSALPDVIAPVFGLVGLGYGAARVGFFKPAEVAGLNKFVFNLAVPVMLFRTLVTTALPAQMEWGFVLSYYVGAFAVYALAVVAGRLAFSQRLSEQGVFGLGASYANMVLLGIPLVLLGYGDVAALPLSLLLVFHSPSMFFTVTALGEAGRGRGLAIGPLLGRALLGLVKNPISAGLLLGLGANLAGAALPAWLDRFAVTLGGATLPCALFALGASLNAYRLSAHWRPAATLVGLKLLVHPLLVWALAAAWGVNPLWTAVAVTMAAMPVGINAYLFAQRYGACVPAVAMAILLSTGLSLGTVAALLWWFQRVLGG